MNTIADIKLAVKSLPEKELDAFSSWFDAFEAKRWDNQIEQDQSGDALSNLMHQAQADFKAGRCKRL